MNELINCNCDFPARRLSGSGTELPAERKDWDRWMNTGWRQRVDYPIRLTTSGSSSVSRGRKTGKAKKQKKETEGEYLHNKKQVGWIPLVWACTSYIYTFLPQFENRIIYIHTYTSLYLGTSSRNRVPKCIIALLHLLVHYSAVLYLHCIAPHHITLHYMHC